jgi:heme exporter protein D
MDTVTIVLSAIQATGAATTDGADERRLQLIGFYIMIGLGILPLLAYLFARGGRFLLYLAVFFFALAVSAITPRGPVLLLPLGIAVIALATSIYQCVTETKERLRQFREEQREREAAFAEYIEAVTARKAPVDPPADAGMPQ